MSHQISKFVHLNKVMTKDDLLDRLHFISGILAALVIADNIEGAKKWAYEMKELNDRLNQVIPS